MKKVFTIFVASSLLAVFAVAFDYSDIEDRRIGCDPSTKSCYYAGAFKPSSKCPSSNSLSAKLCRLNENLRVKAK